MDHRGGPGSVALHDASEVAPREGHTDPDEGPHGSGHDWLEEELAHVFMGGGSDTEVTDASAVEAMPPAGSSTIATAGSSSIATSAVEAMPPPMPPSGSAASSAIVVPPVPPPYPGGIESLDVGEDVSILYKTTYWCVMFRMTPKPVNKSDPYGRWEANCPSHTKNDESGCRRSLKVHRPGIQGQCETVWKLRHWCNRAMSFDLQAVHRTMPLDMVPDRACIRAQKLSPDLKPKRRALTDEELGLMDPLTKPWERAEPVAPEVAPAPLDDGPAGPGPVGPAAVEPNSGSSGSTSNSNSSSSSSESDSS